MNKGLTILSILLIVSVTSLYAQEESSTSVKNNAFKANPLGLMLTLGKINYERRLGEASSVQLGISYFSYGDDGSSFSGLGLIPEYRYYFGKDAMDGFYAAPFVKYRNFTVKDDSEDFKGSLNILGGGAKVGCQWIMGKKENFVMDLAFGGKYQDFRLKVKDGDSDDFDEGSLFHGFSPELHFAIGFVF